jgi:hypothetical protein
MRTDEEIARFCAEHGVTDSDLLIALVQESKNPKHPMKREAEEDWKGRWK